MPIKKLSLAVGLLILISLISANQAQASAYSLAQVKNQVKMLSEKLQIDRAKIADLLYSLDHAFDNDWFKRQIQNRQIKGVFVFESGRGGLIVNYMDGNGFISFAGGRQGARIFLKSWSVGAQIGGAAIWGVGLVMDIKDESRFGGDYDGKNQSATAGGATTYNWTVMMNKRDNHDIFLLKSGRGLEAGVAAERLVITTDW